jgi:hypothetical protein
MPCHAWYAGLSDYSGEGSAAGCMGEAVAGHLQLQLSAVDARADLSSTCSYGSI